jgi:hypothetical protein
MTKKKDGSRFDDFISAARAQPQTPTPETPPEELTAPTTDPPSKKSKSSDPDYMRTTVYLPKKLHRRLKSAAADEEKEISEIVEELVANWLASRTNI